MNRIIVALATVATTMFAMPGSALAVDYGKQKAVYHINGGDERQNLAAMRNIQNHIDAVGADNMDVKVVMHGPGVDLVMRAKDNQDIRTRIDSLKMQNVDFQVCKNTLVSRKIDYKADMYEVSDSDIVPSGVAHLSYLQAQGYTYIKP